MEEWANMLEFWETKPIEYKQTDIHTQYLLQRDIKRTYVYKYLVL